jgi:outer membrane lipoprotein
MGWLGYNKINLPLKIKKGGNQMGKNTWIATVFCLSLFVLHACAPVLSEQSLNRVDRTVTPEALQKNPDRYAGKIVLIGGMILETTVKAKETWMEVLQQPLDGEYRPMGTDKSYGRFIIRFNGFMDPAIYATGRKITLVGEVAGKKTIPLDGMTYHYPVLIPKEYHLWKRDKLASPGFVFGAGAGIIH